MGKVQIVKCQGVANVFQQIWEQLGQRNSKSKEELSMLENGLETNWMAGACAVQLNQQHQAIYQLNLHKQYFHNASFKYPLHRLLGLCIVDGIVADAYDANGIVP